MSLFKEFPKDVLPQNVVGKPRRKKIYLESRKFSQVEQKERSLKIVAVNQVCEEQPCRLQWEDRDS